MENIESYWIRLAGMPLWIAPRCLELRDFFQDYIICPTERDRDMFQNRMGQEFPIRVSLEEMKGESDSGAVSYSLPYLESLAFYRKICHILLNEGIVLFHSSALAIHGKAILFTASSGTGKSTHARLWRESFGSEVTMINDDKPLLKIEEDKVTVYGTPYGGKEGLHTNTEAPVAAIVILHQAEENGIQRISFGEAYPTLLNQTYRRKDAVGMVQTMNLVDTLAKLPVYRLGCTISKEAVEVVYRQLKEDGVMQCG